MVSTANDYMLKHTGEQESRSYFTLNCKINELKEQIQADRFLTIKEKLKKNEKKLETYVQQILSETSTGILSTLGKGSKGGSCFSTENAIYLANPIIMGAGDKRSFHHALNSAGYTLPYIEKLPRYTTWIFLHRNQRMAEDQSVIGMKRIYYDKYGSEALICSDSDEENAEISENAKGDEHEKSGECTEMEVDAKSKGVGKRHEFSEGENCILWMAFQEYGSDEEVAKILTQHIGGTTTEILEQYSKLKEISQSRQEKCASERNEFLEKSLSAAIDSYDSLFCRFCLIFDCRLHDSSLSVNPGEKLPSWSEPEDADEPCSDQCYLLVRQTGEMLESVPLHQINYASERVEKWHFLPWNSKRMIWERDENGVGQAALALGEESEELSHGCEWKPLEKDLLIKGLEIFGRNSCLITRNLLSGLRSCNEVFNYMQSNISLMPHKSDGPPLTLSEDKGKVPLDFKEKEIPSRSRSYRRKGRMQRHKSSSKTVARFPWLKKVGDAPRVQYTPCECQLMCRKDCTCLQNNTCCEKYCGCSKRCKNRYRGCHCAKGQCKSKQCPCFHLHRECDPDVCRNCWVSCGDGSLGKPPKRGEGPCANMKMLLRHQQQILLGRSDVAGWGAFTKHSVNKNDYLGEYTGELIDHYEADKRGKMYDRADSSYLFNLNDQWVLDAYRRGDKLKFANHSFSPNCYCKIMQVGADHRVGIFANEHIKAHQELFYDYAYEPQACPPWARKPELEDPNQNETLASTSQGRAKKHPTRGQSIP